MAAAIQQAGPYIPETDWAACLWLRNFADCIDAAPARYGLDRADADILTGLAGDFHEAFDRAQAPSTRTSPAVAHKDAVRASALGSARVYAGRIRANMGVDNQDLVALGLTPRNTTRRTVSAPITAPVIAVRAGFVDGHELIYHDETTPTSRRKPQGVGQLWLYQRIVNPGAPGPAALGDPQGAELVGAFTKTPFLVRHNAADAGRTVVYFARWATATGLLGPWSTPCWFTITAGGGSLPEVVSVAA